MKINFDSSEKLKLNTFIMRYHNINVKLDELKKDAERIQTLIEEKGILLKEIKKEEDEFMEELHKKYGNFSLQDISDSL